MTKSTLTVLVNREGGAAAAAGAAIADRIETAFEAIGAAIKVELLAAAEMESAIKLAAQQHARIVVAGGDGTIAAAAQLLCGSDTELAVLPLGTLNHFAKDLGIPQKLEAAAALAANGRSESVDIGEVNERCFINNASIGLYPNMVKGRDAVRARRGWPKWLASVPAGWEALSRMRHHRLQIDLGEGKRPVTTPLLFVGNNAYSLEAGSIGQRHTLQEGKLSVYAVARRGRASLIWFALRGMVGMADRRRDFEALGQVPELKVSARSGSVEIGLDGEVVRMSFPLRFRSRAGALRVVVPGPK